MKDSEKSVDDTLVVLSYFQYLRRVPVGVNELPRHEQDPYK